MKHPLHWLSAVFAALALSATPGGAFAQSGASAGNQDRATGDAEAGTGGADAAAEARGRKHFARGVELYSEGDVGGALVEFEAAYAARPSYRLLYNLAQVHAELLDYAAAERNFVRYLRDGGAEIDPERRGRVEAELERLRRRIGTVTITTRQPGASVFIDDQPVGETPLQAAPVSAGQRRVHVQKPGFEPVIRVVNVIGGETQTVEIALRPTAATTTAAELASARSGGGSSATVWAAVATGVLLAASAGASYWAYRGGQDYDDALRQPTTRGALDDLAKEAKLRALVTDILFGATAVSGVVTVVLWSSGDDGESATRPAELRLGLGGVNGRF